MAKRNVRSSELCRWHLVIRPAAQRATSPMLLNTAPLLEEKRHPIRATLVEQVIHPARLDRTRAGPGLTADNDPVNPIQRQLFDGGSAVPVRSAWKR